MDINTQWLPAPGFEGIYSVSSCGKVRRDKQSAGTTAGKILSPYSSRGYQLVYLRKGGEYHTRYIHRLVAEAFIGPINGCVNHKDGDKSNNSLPNLEIVSMRENLIHATRALGKRCGEKHWRTSLKESDIKKIRAAYRAGGSTMLEIANRFGISRTQVSRIVNFKSWARLPAANRSA